MQNKKRLIRLATLVILILICNFYILQPVYQRHPRSFGVICKICRTNQTEQEVALQFAGGKIVSFGQIQGLPSDQIEVKDGSLYRNGEITKTNLPRSFIYPTKKLDPNSFFVLIKDPKSQKFIDFGHTQKSKIIGRILKIW